MNDHLPELSMTELVNCRLHNMRKPVIGLTVVAVAGAVLAAINCQFISDGPHRFMMAYLVAFAFVLSISLGSLFFVLIQHQMRAGWSVVVRRLAEFFCLNVVVVGVLFLPIAWSVWSGNGLIYSWSNTSGTVPSTHTQTAGDSDPLLLHVALVINGDALNLESGQPPNRSQSHALPDKPYLSKGRFLVTWVGLFSYWIIVSVYYYRNSVAQDLTSDVRRTRNMEWWSGVALLLFGFSVTFAAFDLLMMLDSSWYSTIFGVYYFAGCAVAAFATLLLCMLLLKRFERVPDVFLDEVQRDLGRLLFAFVFFWAYIGFSQFMLLWYANMPETTNWLVRRGMSTATGYTNSWGWLAIFLLFGHFLVPFVGIMSRHVKGNSNAMIFWAIWMLVVHYLDLYWIVIPEISSGFTISLIEVGTGLAVVAVYGLAVIWIASQSRLFAVGDPRMNESLTRHAMY